MHFSRSAWAWILMILVWGSSEVGAAEPDDRLELKPDHRFELGYRAVATDDNPNRAAEYSFLRPSAFAGLEFRGVRDQRHLALDARYLNEADYRAEAELDYKGLIKLGLSTESMFHNLDHHPAAPPDRENAFEPGHESEDPAEASVRFTDQDPGDDYFVEVERGQGRVKLRAGSYPAHLQLTYWRLERSGRKQLRFLDENCTSCHMQSRSQTIDRTTEEVKAVADGHFGPVNLVFEQVYREFRDEEPIPVDTFGAHTLRAGPADRQHDEVPESRYVASTLKASTSLAGSVVGAASFTLAERENRSDLDDVFPVKSETDIQKGAADLTFLPTARWTLNFRFRHLDLDNDNNDQINAEGLILFSPAVDHNPVDVRRNVDLTRAEYGASASFRPNRRLTLKADFRREEIDRGNTGEAEETNAFTTPIVIDPVWELPEEENINTAKLTLLARPLGDSSLKINGWYRYTDSDDPAYGTSVETGHQGFAGATWSPNGRWGAHLNLNILSEENNKHDQVLFTTDAPDNLTTFDLDRTREQETLTVGFWTQLHQRLNLNLQYGYLRTRILQDLLFGNQPTAALEDAGSLAIEDESVKYSQRVQNAVATLVWQLAEGLRLTGEGRYILSHARFSPDFSRSGLEFADGVVADVDSEGLGDLSEVDIRQLGGSLGLDWHPVESWTCSVRYTVDDYNNRDGDLFDGTVQTYWASLAKTW